MNNRVHIRSAILWCVLFSSFFFCFAKTEHGGAGSQESKDRPHGELVQGVRVIPLNTPTTAGNLHVYRGEEVRLVFEKADFPYSVHIPALQVSGSAAAGELLSIEFKAKDTGVFPVLCKGKCPAGDGRPFAAIAVREYEVKNAKAIFKTISPKKAGEMIATDNPLILDVRTPSEFYTERIANAMLIPVYELADRIGELEAFKNRPVLVYCRSGNRSIPASQILIRNKFKQVYNMRHGINGWARDNLPIER